VLRRETGVPVALKPINDLMVDSRKLGGILCEAMFEDGELLALTTGIGINLTEADRPMPTGGEEAAALESLMPTTRFVELDAAAMVERLADEILACNAIVARGAFDELDAAWLAVAQPGAALPAYRRADAGRH